MVVGLFGTHFLFQLFCGFFSCIYRHEPPSDPLNLAYRSGLSSSFNIVENPNPVVFTDSGGVEGYVMKSILGRPIYTFEGIPYGESTGRGNRFRSPVAKKPWTGIRPAKRPGSPCLQVHTGHYRIFGREDCLFLNIYTTALPSSSENGSTTFNHPNLPVIVFIHGGAFQFGFGDEYGPAYLLNQNIILVTINYRLGIYGFLSTLDEASPGNYGLKDQALALKWIHQNIHHFGGNSSLITLMGQSSGAASGHLHMISELSRPYFSGVIAFSGHVLSSWVVVTERLVRVTNSRLANLTRCPSESFKFIDCLRELNPFDLARQDRFLPDWLIFPAVQLGPVVEPPGPGAFLTDYPKNVYTRGGVAKYPMVISRTTEEGEQATLFLQAVFAFRSFTSKWKERAPLFLDYKYLAPPERLDQITEEISKFYFGDQDPRTVNSKVYGLMGSDALFNYPMHKQLEAHSKLAPTYGIIFGYKGAQNFAEFVGLGQQNGNGVVHTDDLSFYLNSSSFRPGYKTTDKEYEVVEFMTSWIYNFALTRDPYVIDGDGAELHGFWNPVNAHSPNRFELLTITNNGISIIPEPRLNAIKFWESLVGIYDR